MVDEGDQVAHVLAAPVAGDRLSGRIDWSRRFDHMQQHTGQHLLSAVIAGRFGHPTVSVHFGRDSATLDLGAAAFSHERVVEAEALANEVVTQNRPVRVTFEDASSAAGLRKASDREGILRIVVIDDLDRSACGGTHVRATGEIGAILIRKVERVKQLVRLEFVCGGRAVRRGRADAELLARLAAPFSAAPEELPGLIETQRAELKAAGATRRELEETVGQLRARDLYAMVPADQRGLHVATVREERGPVERLRPTAQAFAAMPGGVFVGAVTNPASLLLASAADSGVDAGRLMKAVLAAENGRGGGNARLAQGSVPDGAGLERVIAAVLAAIG